MAETITYFPQDGAIYAGHHTDIDGTRPSEYLASITPETKDSKTEYKFTDVSEHLANIKRSQLKYREFRRPRGNRQEAARQMDMLERSAALNDSAIQQVTIVQFVQQMIGRIENASIIAKSHTHVPANNLRGKIPEGGFPSVTMQVGRLQEPEITHTDFGQKEFRIRRNDCHLYISREDRMEATIDPFSWSTMNAQKQLLQARDLLCLKELYLAYSSADTTLEDPTAGMTNVVPRAEHDTIGGILGAITSHFTKYRNRISKIVLNNLDFRAIQTNYFVRNNIKQEATQAWGVVPFPGLESQGVTAYISPWVARNIMFGLTEEGHYELDGPKVVDSEYDAKKFADYTPMRDFVGYLHVNPDRFGVRFAMPTSEFLATTTGDVGTITTDKKIEELLGPQFKVEKNEDA